MQLTESTWRQIFVGIYILVALVVSSVLYKIFPVLAQWNPTILIISGLLVLATFLKVFRYDTRKSAVKYFVVISLILADAYIFGFFKSFPSWINWIAAGLLLINAWLIGFDPKKRI